MTVIILKIKMAVKLFVQFIKLKYSSSNPYVMFSFFMYQSKFEPIPQKARPSSNEHPKFNLFISNASNILPLK